MKHLETIEIGQVIQTIADEVTVPYLPRKKQDEMPCIRLLHSLLVDYGWYINTDKEDQRGLICLLAPEYCGRGILSIEITEIRDNVVYARPLQWIESQPGLLLDDIGLSTHDLLNHPFYKAHLKEVTPVLSTDTAKP